MDKVVLPQTPGPIGVFDSGYGGLTILKHIRCEMPEYDFMYLGDNARTPYGTRSFQVVYEFTLQCVTKLFEMGQDSDVTVMSGYSLFISSGYDNDLTVPGVANRPT